MRNAAHRLTTLLVAAAGALVAQCQPAPTPTPSASASPSPYPAYSNQRWGVIVLYEAKGVCTELAGPPRIGAYPGDNVTWRIYNNCGRDASVKIDDLRLSPPGFSGFAGAKTWKEYDDVKRARKDHRELDPYEAGDRSKQVPAGGIADLTLKIKGDAEHGLYTYVVFLNGKADEGDQDIWPPRG
jgi:hypothetical protein